MFTWRPWVFTNKKAVIWDLDNTLYRITPEFGDVLDSVMAKVTIEQLGVDLDFETAKATVKESFAKYRDGGEIFYREYGVDEKKFYKAYHDNVPYELIVPYDGLAERLKQIPQEQFVFTYSSHSLAEKIIETAADAGVPIYEDNSLATALAQLKLGQEIPEDLYKAIVEIYVYFLNFDPSEREKQIREQPKASETTTSISAGELAAGSGDPVEG